jgi:DNA-binding CsgD family transcriptional regulator
MAHFSRLSSREWEVLKLVLEGKSNKQIASSLGISKRTVEFHLRNIYTKIEVNSRVELVLKLANATGSVELEKLRQTTVDERGEIAENRDRFNLRRSWATSFRDAVSIIGKELEMKNLLNSKHVLLAVITALSTGGLFVATMVYAQTIPAYEFKGLMAPLIVIWAIIGLLVGVVGKRNGNTLRRVFFSALFGTGVSPFLIIPLMIIVVLPLGKVAAWFGLIDPATMSNEVATILTKIAVTAVWLGVGLTIGIALLFVTIKKLEPPMVQPHASENGS